MAVDESIVLREAAGEMRRGEKFEEVLGRVLRRHEGTYEEYITLIAKVREASTEKGLTLPQAARQLAGA